MRRILGKMEGMLLLWCYGVLHQRAQAQLNLERVGLPSPSLPPPLSFLPLLSVPPISALYMLPGFFSAFLIALRGLHHPLI